MAPPSMQKYHQAACHCEHCKGQSLTELDIELNKINEATPLNACLEVCNVLELGLLAKKI
jgi:hypothetical protein